MRIGKVRKTLCVMVCFLNVESKKDAESFIKLHRKVLADVDLITGGKVWRGGRRRPRWNGSHSPFCSPGASQQKGLHGGVGWDIDT